MFPLTEIFRLSYDYSVCFSKFSHSLSPPFCDRTFGTRALARWSDPEAPSSGKAGNETFTVGYSIGRFENIIIKIILVALIFGIVAAELKSREAPISNGSEPH